MLSPTTTQVHPGGAGVRLLAKKRRALGKHTRGIDIYSLWKESHAMHVCVVPGGNSWADEDSEKYAWVIVIVLVMSLVASGLLDPDHALQALSLLASLLNRGR